jgi:hypothetical protein
MAVNNVESTGKVTSAFTTYSATGNREDLSNAIYNIDPFDTPVMSGSKRRTTKNRTFDWQTEFLPTVDPNNAQPEGFLLLNSPAQPTLRQSNATQISKRDATVSGSQEEVDAAGKSSEMAHQMAMTAKVLKSDLETIACSRQALNAGNDSTPTPRTTEAICHWLGRATDRTGAVNGAVAPGTSLPGAYTATAVFPTPGAAVQITEAMLGAAMQQAYINGASPTLLIVPPGVKRTVSTFTGRSTTQVLVGKTEVVSTVDVIATDFGRIKVAPSRWIPTDVGLLLDQDYLAFAFFRNFRQFLMARVGDAETRMIVVEWGIEMRNPLAHILFNSIKP